MSNQRYAPEFNDEAVRLVVERGHVGWSTKPRLMRNLVLDGRLMAV